MIVVDGVASAEWLLRTLECFSWSGWPAGVDTETTGCDPKKQSPVENAQLWCLTVAWGDPRKPNQIGPSNYERAFVPRLWVPYLTPWLEDHTALKVGSGFMRYDRHVLWNMGIDVRGVEGDTERESRLLDPSKQKGHGLKPQGAALGYRIIEFEDIAGAAVPGQVKSYKKDTNKWFCRDCSWSAKDRGWTAQCPTCGFDGDYIQYCAGAEFQNVNKGRRLVPLPELWRDYPQRRGLIVEYATLDAAMSLDVHWHLQHQLRGVRW